MMVCNTEAAYNEWNHEDMPSFMDDNRIGPKQLVDTLKRKNSAVTICTSRVRFWESVLNEDKMALESIIDVESMPPEGDVYDTIVEENNLKKDVVALCLN